MVPVMFSVLAAVSCVCYSCPLVVSVSGAMVCVSCDC